MALTQRTGDILRLIVTDYISSAVPVGSASLVRHHGLNVSPATIRNDMVKLEDEGYILRLHTSAGGIPADKGYRFFVESLPANQPLDESRQQALDQALEGVRRDIEQWSRVAAATVSELIGTLAFVTVPKANATRVKQFELLQIHELSVLLVLILQGAHVLRHLIPLDAPATAGQLEHARNRLVRLFAGKSVKEIATEDVEDLTSFERAVIEAMIDMLRDQESAVTHDYVMEGLSALFEQPELSRPGSARELAEALDDDETISAIAAGATPDGVVRVVIGSENPMATLREFSVVVSRYGVPGQSVGVVGLIGPTRLAYHQALPVVGHAANLLSGMVAEVYTS
ncbi:MAG: heat-inducible transcription repressor HrcA [Chloroflexi bacterium]|nr:heat-inducible transcription repressor HrcA [Chloroflexota bacterium]